MSKRILILGAESQLGKTLYQLQTKHDTVFANRTQADLTNYEKIRSILSNGWDYCINTAAYTAVDKAESEPEKAFLVNSKSVGELAKSCHFNSVKLIHISTDYVFSGDIKKPYTEAHPIQPVNIYGQSKAEGETNALNYNPGTYIIRTGGLYSPFGDNFVKKMIRIAQTQKEINVINDQWNTPTYAADLAQAIIKIIDKDSDLFGVFHYTNQGITTWYDFAQAIFEIQNMQVKINKISTENYPAKVKRPLYCVLDKTKIKETFDIEIPQWKDSLKSMLYHLK